MQASHGGTTVTKIDLSDQEQLIDLSIARDYGAWRGDCQSKARCGSGMRPKLSGGARKLA